MSLTEDERRQRQREYNRQYYLAHRERKLEQNARSARTWRERYPERYRESQERCRARVRELNGIEARKPRIRECVVCRQVKPHKARDMCVVCYGKWRWQNHKRIVDSFGSPSPTYGEYVAVESAPGPGAARTWLEDDHTRQ